MAFDLCIYFPEIVEPEISGFQGNYEPSSFKVHRGIAAELAMNLMCGAFVLGYQKNVEIAVVLSNDDLSQDDLQQMIDRAHHDARRVLETQRAEEEQRLKQARRESVRCEIHRCRTAMKYYETELKKLEAKLETME